MKRAFLLLVVIEAAIAQTQFRADQILGGLPAGGGSAESQWCPGPVLTLVNDRTLIVGPNWSTERPCYAHFNLAPPAAVDPIHVSSFRAPVQIELTESAGATLQDELYIRLMPPVFDGPVMTKPQRVVVSSTQPGAYACSDCLVEPAPPGVRMFPALSMPVGMASIVNGRFHPALDPILDTKQFYLGANVNVTMRRDAVGMWIELSGVAAQVSQAVTAGLQLENTRAAMAAEIPPSVTRIANVEGELQAMRAFIARANMNVASAQSIMLLQDQVFHLQREIQELKTRIVQ